MLPLTSLKAEESAVIHDITGEPEFISRISATGFTQNTQVTMVQNGRWGPLIVFIRGTQMALGRAEAGKIMVRKRTG